MAARTGSGSPGQASMTAFNSGLESAGRVAIRVADWVAVWGRVGADSVGFWRDGCAEEFARDKTQPA